MTDTIKRNADGSIDTAHYMRLGRKARSDEVYSMARATRAATRRAVLRLRAGLSGIAAMRAPARA